MRDAEQIAATLLEADEFKEFSRTLPSYDAQHELHHYFGDESSHNVRKLTRRYKDISGEIDVIWRHGKKYTDTWPYISVNWDIENTETGRPMGRGGLSQNVPLTSTKDIAAFLADLRALEKSVTVEFSSEHSEAIMDRISQRIYDGNKPGSYGQPAGYASRKK